MAHWKVLPEQRWCGTSFCSAHRQWGTGPGKCGSTLQRKTQRTFCVSDGTSKCSRQKKNSAWENFGPQNHLGRKARPCLDWRLLGFDRKGKGSMLGPRHVLRIHVLHRFLYSHVPYGRNIQWHLSLDLSRGFSWAQSSPVVEDSTPRNL